MGKNQHVYTPCGEDCGTLIIHVFLIFFTPTMPATIFTFTVSFFPFGSATVFPLGFAAILASSRDTTFITTVGLPPKTRPANIEIKTAPTTMNRN